MKRRFFSRSYLIAVLLFLYVPILVVALFAFNESKSRANFKGFTLKWFANLLQNKTILDACLNSLWLAFLAATIATILGTSFSVQISKLTMKQQKLFLNLNYFPIINADVTLGVSLMMMMQLILNILQQNLGFTTVLIAHVVICIPYVVFTIIPKIEELSKNQLNAALDLGCTPKMAFLKIVVPQITIELFSAFMIAFSISFDDFTISYFTAGTSFQTLPILIYSMVRKRITPAINALFTIIFMIALLILILVNFIKPEPANNK